MLPFLFRTILIVASLSSQMVGFLLSFNAANARGPSNARHKPVVDLEVLVSPTKSASEKASGDAGGGGAGQLDSCCMDADDDRGALA